MEHDRPGDTCRRRSVGLHGRTHSRGVATHEGGGTDTVRARRIQILRNDTGGEPGGADTASGNGGTGGNGGGRQYRAARPACA